MKIAIKDDVRRIALCIAAGVIMAVNIRTFVHTGGLLPGGFSGLTLLLQQISAKFFGIKIPYGPIYILMNLVPAVISYRKIGKKFTLYSGLVILIVSIMTDILPAHVITYDTLLISIFGGMINGFAIAMCLTAHATSGGTDFIAIRISEKFGVDAWNYILIFNAAVLGIDGLLFGWDKALYSIIFQFASTQVINTLYKRYKKNTMFIVTVKPKEVTECIYSITGHGATDICATGTYLNSPRTLVYSVVSSDELRQLVGKLKEVDSEAFVNVIKTEQVAGRFYMRPND